MLVACSHEQQIIVPGAETADLENSRPRSGCPEKPSIHNWGVIQILRVPLPSTSRDAPPTQSLLVSTHTPFLFIWMQYCQRARSLERKLNLESESKCEFHLFRAQVKGNLMQWVNVCLLKPLSSYGTLCKLFKSRASFFSFVKWWWYQ